MNPKVLTVIVLAALLLILTPLFLGRTKTPAPQAPAPQPPALPLPETPQRDPNAPLITKAVYDSLQLGITYDQASDAIGAGETESHSEYSRGVAGFTSPSVTGWYTWTNPDGSFATLGFVNNKLAEKKEEKLK